MKFLFCVAVLMSMKVMSESYAACTCTAIFDPVCCKTSEGVMTKSNSCQCACSKGDVISREPCPEEGKCSCPEIFKPVCCEVNGKLEDKTNQCECTCAKGKVVSEGHCPTPSNCICPLIFDPVCCLSNGITFVASNSCFCQCDGTVLYKGECSPTPSPSPSASQTPTATPSPKPSKSPKPPCICPKIFAPVCCVTPKGRSVKDNSCFCKCNKGISLPLHFCRRPKCICPAIYEPVCCQIKSNYTFKAGNACECGCMSGRVVPGKCNLTLDI